MTKMMRKALKHFTWYDISLAKIDLLVLGFLLAKLFPVLTSLHRGYYVGWIVLMEIYFAYVIWGRKSK